MDRLTSRDCGSVGIKACYKKCDHPNSNCDCVRLISVYEKLATYEDTGLTPEEIVAAVKQAQGLEEKKMCAKLAEYCTYHSCYITAQMAEKHGCHKKTCKHLIKIMRKKKAV